MNLKRAKALYFQHLRQRNLRDRSIQRYSWSINKLGQFIGNQDLAKVPHQRWNQISQAVIEGYFPETSCGMINTWKTFFKYLYDMGNLSSDLSQHFPKQKKPSAVLKNVPSIQQVKSIIMAPDINTALGYRNT